MISDGGTWIRQETNKHSVLFQGGGRRVCSSPGSIPHFYSVQLKRGAKSLSIFMLICSIICPLWTQLLPQAQWRIVCIDLILCLLAPMLVAAAASTHLWAPSCTAADAAIDSFCAAFSIPIRSKRKRPKFNSSPHSIFKTLLIVTIWWRIHATFPLFISRWNIKHLISW